MKRSLLLKFVIVLSGLQATGCACRCFNDQCREPASDLVTVDPSSFIIGGTSDSKTAGGLASVHFEYKQTVPSGQEIEALKQNVSFLKKNPNVKVVIEAYCDSVGGPEYNKKLGMERAKNTLDFFLKNEIAPERLKLVSLGSASPLSESGDDTPTGRSKDRRINFVVVEM